MSNVIDLRPKFNPEEVTAHSIRSEFGTEVPDILKGILRDIKTLNKVGKTQYNIMAEPSVMPRIIADLRRRGFHVPPQYDGESRWAVVYWGPKYEK